MIYLIFYMVEGINNMTLARTNLVSPLIQDHEKKNKNGLQISSPSLKKNMEVRNYLS